MSESAAMKTSFLELTGELADPATARYAVLPVGYEATAGYRKGTAAGPAAIIDASCYVEYFDEELKREIHTPGVATLPAVPAADTVDEQMQRITAAADPVMAAGKFLIALGGEHSITAPLVRQAAEHFGPISVLQLDAHADLRDTSGGTKHSHACVMRRVLEVTDSIAQVGVRSYSAEEHDQCRDRIDRIVHVDRADWIDRALALLTDRVYVTIDIDAMDPSLCPGVGTPEPGGLVWSQATALLRRVCTERQVIAADIVEVRPLGDNHVTEFVAARLACKIIAYNG